MPFKGGGPAAQAVAGGHVAVVTSSLPVAKAQMEGKVVKGLFVTGNKRSPSMPDVPALRETGYKFADVDLQFWWGLFVPKGTPEPIRPRSRMHCRPRWRTLRSGSDSPMSTPIRRLRPAQR